MSYIISYRPLETIKNITRGTNSTGILVTALRKGFGDSPITMEATDDKCRYRLEGMVAAGLQELQQLLDELNNGVNLVLTWTS